MRSNTNTRRRSYGSGADDAYAVLGASLTELSRGLADQSERSRIRDRQNAQDEETRKQHKLLDEDRDEAARLRREAERRANRDDASQQFDQFRGDVGGGGVDLPMDQVGQAMGLAETAGRPGAIRPVARAPMAPVGAAAAAMGDPVSAAILGLPTAAMQFQRTPAETKVYEADRAQQRQNADIDELLPTLPPATQASVRFNRAAGRPTTLQPSETVTPEAAAALEEAKRKAGLADYTERQRIQDRFIRGRQDADGGGGGGSRIKGDNPKMPRGVLAYLGQLTAKYGEDRAAAAKELRSAIPSLQQAHPDLDIADLQRQFGAAFPKPEDDGLGLPGASPIVKAPVAPPAAPAATATSPAAAPPAGATPPPGAARTPPPIGKPVRLRDGRTVIVTGHNPDGSFTYQ